MRGWERSFIATYIMTNRAHGTLYVGVTSTLITRVRDHVEGRLDGFTKRWGLTRLVWYEPNESIVAAIRKEKLIKSYPRDWKISLIQRLNPHWDDLYPPLVAPAVWKHDPPGTTPNIVTPGLVPGVQGSTRKTDGN